MVSSDRYDRKDLALSDRECQHVFRYVGLWVNKYHHKITVKFEAFKALLFLREVGYDAANPPKYQARVKSSSTEFILTDHALVSIDRVFNAILRRIAVQGQQTNDGVLTLCLVIDASIREELHGLVQMEFVY
jgi:hypothetical protein